MSTQENVRHDDRFPGKLGIDVINDHGRLDLRLPPRRPRERVCVEAPAAPIRPSSNDGELVQTPQRPHAGCAA